MLPRHSHRGNAARIAANFSHAETGMLELEFAQVTDPGRVREHNEDFIGHLAPNSPAQVRSQGWVFALADGVGGQDKGEVASRIAVESLLDGFRKNTNGESHVNVLPKLVQAANTRVLEAGMTARPGGVAMATTIVVCALRYDKAVVSHVGDSRCYLIRRGHANLITRDHTVTNEQIRLGLLTTREASRAATKHILSRSLGNDMVVNVDTSEHQVMVGDVLLLCSDGLHGAIEASEIAAVASHGTDLNTAAHKLVGIAKQRDGSDNISLQVIRVRSVERVGMYRGRPYKLR
jgi:PPM family protein phosphatase